MSQKCPICKRVVSTDGADPGSTIVCPGCGTGIVVERNYGAEPESVPSAAAGARNQQKGQIGSYSLKFDSSQLRKESIFGDDGSRRSEPESRRPEPVPPPPADPRYGAQVRVDSASRAVQDDALAAGGDPDMTIGFGGAEDLLFESGVHGRQDTAPQGRADDDLLYEPTGERRQGAGNAGAGALDDWLIDGLEGPVGGQHDMPGHVVVTDSHAGHADLPLDLDIGHDPESAPTERFDEDLSRALGDDDFIAGLDDDGQGASAVFVDDTPIVDDVDYEVPPAEAAPLKAADSRSGRKSRASRRRARPAVDGGKGRRKLGPVLIAPLVICLIGAVLGQTDYGYFGINLVTGKVGKSDSYYKTVNDTVLLVGDSRVSFMENIRRLDKAYIDDDSRENLVALLGALNRFRERYPDAFSADPGLAARLNDLMSVASRKDSSAAGMTQVTDLLGQGKYSEARAVLDNMMAQSAQDVDALYYYGKIALGQGKAEEAQKYFELALIRNPGMLSARYFLAESYVAQKKLVEAKVILNEIAGKDAKHLPSRILSAKIAVSELNYDEASRLAKEVISLGMPGPDTDEIFEAHRVLARVAEAGGNPPEQLAQMKAALELKPADEPTATETGRLMISQGKRGEVVDILKPCRESGCVSEDFLLVFAETCFLDEKFELAETAVAQGVDKYPQSPRFGVLVGRQHLAQNRIRSAISALEGAIAIDSSFVDAYTLLAEALNREGKMQEAVDVLARGMGIFGDKPRLLTQMADIQIEMKDVAGAETSLRRAVALDPDEDTAQMKLGMVIKSQGRNDEAAAILNVLEKKKALDFDGTIALADAYLSVGDVARARDILEKLAADNPDRPEASSAWGRALGIGRSYDKAIDILMKVRTRFPANSQANFYLGDVYMATKAWNEAISYYGDAVKIDGENNLYRLALARAFMALGTVDGETEARKQLDVIASAYAAGSVSVEEMDAEVYLLRGRILFAREKYSQAMKDFEDALRLAPTRRDIMIEFGRSLYEMARYDDAAAYFRQVVAGDGQNPDANYYLGRIALRSGDTDRATDYLVESVKRNPARFPEAHRLLGLIYKDKGLRSLARDSFRAYIKYTPDRKSSEALEVQRMLDKESY